MAKAPLAGAVKTRLCPPLTNAQAAELAAAFLLDTWSAVVELAGVVPLLAYAGDAAALPPPLRKAELFEQPHGDLGARIEATARAGLARAARVVVIGSDLPGLTAAHLREAEAALHHSDAAVGPSSDGGYYLIGLARVEPGLFDCLPWSAPNTLRATWERLVERGYAPVRLSPFDDVDDAGDLARLERALAAGTLAAPATAAALERMR
jgi:rSAM/selenodomain-associated transferase 1